MPVTLNERVGILETKIVTITDAMKEKVVDEVNSYRSLEEKIQVEAFDRKDHIKKVTENLRQELLIDVSEGMKELHETIKGELSFSYYISSSVAKAIETMKDKIGMLLLAVFAALVLEGMGVSVVSNILSKFGVGK